MFNDVDQYKNTSHTSIFPYPIGDGFVTLNQLVELLVIKDPNRFFKCKRVGAATLSNIVKHCQTSLTCLGSWEGIGTIAPPYTLIQTRGPFYNLFIVVFTNYLQLLEI